MKNLWFKFYASDFYMDTIAWDEEMVGLHIRLMCQQWINDGVEFDGKYPIGLNEHQREIFDKIRHKYSVKKSGKIFNKRLKKTQADLNVFVENARNAGRKGASARWGKDGKPYRVPQENPNGVSMAIQKQNTDTENTVVVGEKEQPFFEMFKRASGNFFSDQVLLSEVGKFMNKYPAVNRNQAAAIINTWVGNMQSEPPETQSGTKPKSSYT